MLFGVIGIAAAVAFLSIGSLAQVFLRSRAARYTAATDVFLFLLATAILVHAGVAATYSDAAA